MIVTISTKLNRKKCHEEQVNYFEQNLHVLKRSRTKMLLEGVESEKRKSADVGRQRWKKEILRQINAEVKYKIPNKDVLQC